MSEIPPPELPSDSGAIAARTFDAMDAQATLQVTVRSPTTVVVPIGPVGCGKTTLITTIYDQFQLGPFAEALFAGSETLLAFERRSFLSRTISGQSVARMERTRLGDREQYLHLALQPRSQSEPVRDILFADVSGELYERLRDDPTLATTVASLSGAHYVAILVDAEELAAPKRHHAVVHSTRLLVRSMVEAGLLPEYCQLQLVLTKWDLATVLHERETETIGLLLSELNQVLPDALDQSHAFVTAARPRAQAVPWAMGCARLLQSWRYRYPRNVSASVRIDSERRFDHFTGTAIRG